MRRLFAALAAALLIGLAVVPAADAHHYSAATMERLAQNNWHCGHGVWGCWATTGMFTGNWSGAHGWHMWGTYTEIKLIPWWPTHNCWEDQWWTHGTLDRWTRSCS